MIQIKEINNKKVKDLTGKVFGSLTVVGFAGAERGSGYWWVSCACGSNEFKVSSANLNRGSYRSCGCLKKEFCRSKLHDLTNKTFERLHVLGRDSKQGSHRQVYWKCRCQCGNITVVSSQQLRTGRTKSCGCYHNDQLSKLTKKRLRCYRLAVGADPNIPLGNVNRQLRSLCAKVMLQAKVRDNYTCQLCGNRTGAMCGHHIFSIKQDPARSADITNIITLCKSCHTTAHNNNTRQDPDPKIQDILLPLIGCRVHGL